MATTAPRILIADDQADVLEALRLLLKSEGYQAETVDAPAACLRALEHRDFDVVLIDLNYARDTTSGQEGLDLLTRIHSADESLPVVVTQLATMMLGVVDNVMLGNLSIEALNASSLGRLVRSALGLSALVAGLAGLFSVLLGRRLVRPIEALTEASSRIGRGDLSTPISGIVAGIRETARPDGATL